MGIRGILNLHGWYTDELCLEPHPHYEYERCQRKKGHKEEHQACKDAVLPNSDGSDFNYWAHPDSMHWST